MYIDVLFAFNWMMDMLVLIAASFVLRIGRSGKGKRGWQWGRMCLAAAFGAAGSCLLSVMQLVRQITWIGTGLPALLAGIVLAACMTTAAWPLPSYKVLWRRVPVVYANAFLIGGICSWLQVHMRTTPYMVLLLVSAAGCMISRELLWRRQEENKLLREVRIACGGPVVSVKGIIDTGNFLTLPGTDIPVAVIWKDAIWPAMTEKQRRQYRRLCVAQKACGKADSGTYGKAVDKAGGEPDGKMDDKESGDAGSRPDVKVDDIQEILSDGWRLVPYHSVGRSFGILPAFCIPHVYVRSEESEFHLEQVWMAICTQPVSAQGKYSILMYSELHMR